MNKLDKALENMTDFHDTFVDGPRTIHRICGVCHFGYDSWVYTPAQLEQILQPGICPKCIDVMDRMEKKIEPNSWEIPDCDL